MLQQVAWDLQTTNATANAAFKAMLQRTNDCVEGVLAVKDALQQVCTEARAAIQQTRVDTNDAIQHIAADNSNLRAELAHNHKELQRMQDGLGSALEQLPGYVKGRIQEVVRVM